MKLINFAKTPSIINQYMAELRDVTIQKDRMRFRKNIERISFCMAYEISKTLTYASKMVQTPLAKAEANVLAETPVIAFVLRAGLAMQQGFTDVFDGADHCFISAYRDEGTAENIQVHLEYLASPNLTGRTVILVDPMLATAHSLVGGYQALCKKGIPKKIHVACIVAAPEGIDRLEMEVPTIQALWVAAVDEKLNKHAYIVPGLGDAGDLAFGNKT